jgi:hypothetical protein
MDPWKRFRLLACLAVMLGMLAAGGFARLMWGVPEAPYGIWFDHPDLVDSRSNQVPRTGNPLEELHRYHFRLWWPWDSTRSTPR